MRRPGDPATADDDVRPDGHPARSDHSLGRGPVLVIGLTGPIACGKSTVAAMLGELGGLVIDADALVREVTAPGERAVAAIRERFGDGVFDATGVLDRAALAGIVFSHPAALADLEAIVHPGVRQRIEKRLKQAQREDELFVVVEAIKLVEGGLAERCDEVWLIECPEAVQRARLVGRGMPEADAERRMATQGPDLAARLATRADRRIDSEGPLEVVRERVHEALADALARGFAGLPWGPVEGR